jgi:hypothetical protein
VRSGQFPTTPGLNAQRSETKRCNHFEVLPLDDLGKNVWYRVGTGSFGSPHVRSVPRFVRQVTDFIDQARFV